MNEPMPSAQFANDGQVATRPHVLVVDDDEDALRALDALLQAEGFSSSTALGGEAALSEARRKPPDVVLTDLQMPRMGGVELCRHLHEIDRDLPVIVMTAFSDLTAAIGSLRAGATDYLIKPQQRDAVLSSIERAIAKRASRQQRDEYLSLVAHDLRSPLASILFFVSTLKRSMAEKAVADDPGVRLAERAERNVKRIDSMLDELTEATSLESQGVTLHLGLCDLRTLVADVVDRLDDIRARRIVLGADDGSSLVVRADASCIERVIANLVTNALKYSPDDARVNLRLARKGSDVELQVTDRGIGIAPESIEMLFDRYYRATAGRTRASGLGLGLYIARLIVEAHGGRIDVSSVVGEGSTFRVLLPSHAAR